MPSASSAAAPRRRLLPPHRASSRSSARSTAAVITRPKTAISDSPGERAQALERLAHLGPALLRLARLLERAPDVVQEQAHVGLRDRLRVALQGLGQVERDVERHAEARELVRGALQAGAEELEAAVAERPHEAEPLRSAPARRARPASPQRSVKCSASTISGGSSVKGCASARVKSSTAAEDEPGRALHDALDRLEVEALGLQVLDQLEPRHVLGAVVAGAPPDLRRRQQPARLVGAHVAHGHADLGGQLVDREQLGGRAPRLCEVGHSGFKLHLDM